MQARLVLLLVLAMAVPSVSRAQVTSEPGVVIEATPIRIDPAATVPLTTLPRGMDVTVLAIQDGWLQVAFEDLRYGRRVGYVPRSTVSFSLPTPPVAAARVETPAAPQPTAVAHATPAPAKPADKRPAAASTTKPAAPTAASTRRPATTQAAATTAPVAASTAPARPEPVAPHATASPTPASRPAPAAAAKPAARPAVQLVEADFPDLVTPKTSANRTAASASAASAATATPAKVSKPVARPPVQLVEADFPDLVTPTRKPAKGVTDAAVKPAARPPVRLVEAEFPDLVTPPKTSAAKPVARHVVSIGDAFPDAAGSTVAEAASNTARPVTGALLPTGSTQPASAATAPRPAVRLVHNEFPAVASAPAETEEPKPAARSVVSIGNAFPALAESAPAAAHDVQLVDGHVSLDLGVDASVFDDRSTDLEVIVARVLKHTVLPRVRQMAKALPQVPDARGIRVLYRIPHANPQALQAYRIELVADMPHVVAFAVAGTTDEAFVAGSTLRVDGNGIRVDLTRIAD